VICLRPDERDYFRALDLLFSEDAIDATTGRQALPCDFATAGRLTLTGAGQHRLDDS
jgi:hypothetical protein